MIERRHYTPNGDDPPCPVPISDLCTVPTMEMACLLRDLVVGGRDPAQLDILEIGTGSGFQAAILANQCRSVVTIDLYAYPGTAERLPENVAMMVGNGYEAETQEEFDGVLVTFAASRISLAWGKQVKDGGRLVVPVQCGSSCAINVYERHKDLLVLVDTAAYANFTAGIIQ